MQLSTQDIDEVRGQPLYASDGEKAGDIEDIFLDDQTSRPEWVRIGVGLFGMSNVLVPLEPLTRYEDGLRAPYPKDQIKDAPRVDDNYVSPEQESELYRYYGLASASPSELNERRGQPDDPITQGTPAMPPSGQAPAGDVPGVPHYPEEQSLMARGEATPGQVRLRKWGP
jgi:hypothetical protein